MRPTVRTVSFNEDSGNLRQVPGPLPEVVSDGHTDTRFNNSQFYTYQFGIKNIQLSNSAYEQSGIFVTRPIDVEGNIMEISLSSIESHPLFDELSGLATDRFTSIEYYIALKDNPSLGDWKSILPEETTVVKSERLFFDGSSAELRFIANISDELNTRVYRNGIRMNNEDWYFTNRGAKLQLAATHDSSALYTIDYVPDSNLQNPWSIEVKDTDSQKTRTNEVFTGGTDSHNSIRLSRYPYINFDAVNSEENFDPNGATYRPIEVYLRNADITDGEGGSVDTFLPIFYNPSGEFVTVNRTDYRTQRGVFLEPYSLTKPHKVMEYSHNRNRLVFTESFNRSELHHNEETNHGNATIDVHYDYLTTTVRMKIILRKNSGDDMVITPSVSQYQLKFKIMM